MADNIHASSTSGDPAKMPDGWAASVGALTVPRGRRLGEPTVPAQQAIPGSGEITPREQYGFQSPGEPGYLGQDGDDYHALNDAQRPSLPNPEFSGESGTTNMGPQGETVDWGSVAPYKYPEYPMQSNAADVHISASAVPLT